MLHETCLCLYLARNARQQAVAAANAPIRVPLRFRHWKIQPSHDSERDFPAMQTRSNPATCPHSLRFRHWKIRPSQDPERIRQISPGCQPRATRLSSNLNPAGVAQLCHPYRVPRVKHRSFPGFHPALACLILSGSIILAVLPVTCGSHPLPSVSIACPHS